MVLVQLQANNPMQQNRRETKLQIHDHIIYEKDILHMELELCLRSKGYMLGIRAKLKQTSPNKIQKQLSTELC